MSIRTWLGKLSLSRMALSRYQGAANFLKLLNGYSPFPLNIDLHLTMRCNLACDFCICRQEANAPLVVAFREPELSLDEWKGIVRDIKRSFYFRPNLNLLGGEPSIYKEYLDLAAFIKQEGFRCSYTTNGTFLARDAAEIVAIGVDVIAISIDGGRDLHDSIRGAQVFERAAAGIQAIKERKKAQGKKSPRLFLACTISGANYAHLSDLVDVAKELDINDVTFLHLQFHDVELGAHGIDVADLLAEIEQARRKAAAVNCSINFYPALKTDQIATYYLQPSHQLGKGCVSPWLRMVIVPNGKVIPCEHFVVGNVRAAGATIKSIWNGAKFQAFRRRLAKNKLLPECERCCRKQY